MEPVTEDFLKSLVEGSRLFKFRKHPEEHGNDYILYTVTHVINEHAVELMNTFDTGEGKKTMDFAQIIQEAKWWYNSSFNGPDNQEN